MGLEGPFEFACKILWLAPISSDWMYCAPEILVSSSDKKGTHFCRAQNRQFNCGDCSLPPSQTLPEHRRYLIWVLRRKHIRTLRHKRREAPRQSNLELQLWMTTRVSYRVFKRHDISPTYKLYARILQQCVIGAGKSRGLSHWTYAQWYWTLESEMFIQGASTSGHDIKNYLLIWIRRCGHAENLVSGRARLLSEFFNRSVLGDKARRRGMGTYEVGLTFPGWPDLDQMQPSSMCIQPCP